MPSLIASIEGMQKEVCQLGAGNCKAACGDKLNEFKQRVKNCFSINSSLDEALKQAKSSQNDSVCYSDLKTVAERYKRQSLKGNSELREDLSVQDIVDCEGVRNKVKGAVGAKKAIELCSEVNQELLVRQQEEQAEKEELERQEREKERLEELERQKEEEHRRKQEEFEDRARMIQADMGYITNENKGALDSQAQSFGIKGQSPEDQKRQAYGAKAIKTSEIKKPKEPVKTEKTENEKESKKEKKEDKKSNSEKEDKSEEDKKEDEKPTEKDKKEDKKPLEKDQILKQHRQAVIDMEYEIFYKNKNSKTLPFKFSPFLVSFKLPADIQERSLRVNVLSPTGSLIYTAPIRIKKKKKDLVSLIDKVQ